MDCTCPPDPRNVLITLISELRQLRGAWDRAWTQAEVNEHVAKMVADDRDEALGNVMALEQELDAARAALAAIRDRHGRHGERDWCDACWPGTTYPCWTRTTAERGLGTEEET